MHLIDQELNLMLRGQIEEAWKICEELERTTPNDVRAKFNRGWFLIHKGRYQEGYQCLEYGRSLDVYGNKPLNTNKPIWRGEDLSGKNLLINLESGYGDQIMSARFVAEVEKRGGNGILACSPNLVSLFKRIPGCYNAIPYDEVERTRFNYWVPGFSSSWIFGTTFDTLPNDQYIFCDPIYKEKWKNKLKTDKKFKIGLRWGGNPKFEHQQFRTFPAENLINLHSENPHIQFYSLQRDDNLKELPNEIIDLQHDLENWKDTAACIDNLDLVISSCTSIPHLSSAMTKPTWVIVPILPYHVWARGNKHSPWYKNTTTIFRQSEFGKWDKTFSILYKEIKKKFPSD